MKRSAELEKDALLITASHMTVTARTAPKTCGIDNIEVFVIDDEKTKALLVSKMMEISQTANRPSLARDANSIAASSAIVAIGVKSNPSGLNCGFCGHATCEELKKTKGVCAYNSIDLGIAVSSAVLAADQVHADNRIMYSIGRACIELKLFSAGINQALGIPLSATGKNPFFDRK